MENATPGSVEIPTVLPGFEEDDAREKLLLDATVKDPDGDDDEEEIIARSESPTSKSRRWKVVRTLVAFAVFVCILAIAVSWFFRIGWFTQQKAQPISRNTSKEGQTSPATEDEKLKMALSLVASPAPANATDPDLPNVLQESKGKPELQTDDTVMPPDAGVDSGQRALVNTPQSYSLTSPKENSPDNSPANNSKTVTVASRPLSTERDDARSRSVFFGISKQPGREEETRKTALPSVATAMSQKDVAHTRIPFGTLLPVRLIGSIYTLRSSGGLVRMELTCPIEGKGYSYPAGTMIIGNVRGGESDRAFVAVIGLIDPVSGELVKFSGELLGRDGATGIEGKRRNLTSRWAQVFRSMKETAASVLSSVGAIRSGSTVILSEPVRRGTESMTSDLSGVVLQDGREHTFLEVAAGSNGYVLVTGLPENSAATGSIPILETAKE